MVFLLRRLELELIQMQWGVLFLVRGENQDSRGKTSQTRACLSKVPTTFRAQKSQLSNFNLLVLKSWCFNMLTNVRKTKRIVKVDSLEPWRCEEIKRINCDTRKVSWILRNRPPSREPLSSTHIGRQGQNRTHATLVEGERSRRWINASRLFKSNWHV